MTKAEQVAAKLLEDDPQHYVYATDPVMRHRMAHGPHKSPEAAARAKAKLKGRRKFIHQTRRPKYPCYGK